MSSARTPSIPQAPAELSQPFRPSRFGERFGQKIDPALRPAVSDEQLNMVLGHTRLGTLVATAFAVLLALQLRGVALPTWVIDTPGVRSFGLAHVDPQQLIGAFPDLEELTDACPRGCTHAADEPECGLDEAVADGRTDADRVDSYRRLLAARSEPAY